LPARRWMVISKVFMLLLLSKASAN